ncbi:LysE family transporter [Paenibacillus xylanilyticus]|uniref:LysE family transporter n=1 Tax=Paenibacillus xylanilyticus TaxID=248903 RepID=A0A7Y6EUP4_9BACL|nr:LysE family transporter [Paenibacillus xylanilyticus]NUU74963.1 LysE family transporter [Paenibacillus xylanilyticus]
MSVQLLISYIFLGLTLAAPIGPVNSARLDKGIKNGFWHAWMVGAGSMIADAAFMLLIYLGLVQFLNIPMVQILLWLVGGFTLTYTGIESILQINKLKLHSSKNRKDSLIHCFMLGFFMSITSPMSIIFWLGIYGSILAKTAVSFGTSHLLIYSSMIFIGLTLWDVLVAGLTTGMRRYLNQKSLAIISVVSGLSLVGFGVYFALQGLRAIFS